MSDLPSGPGPDTDRPAGGDQPLPEPAADPSSIIDFPPDPFPPERLPLVPESILRKYKVHQPGDTRFRACARLRQALYREELGAAIGSYAPTKRRRRKLGSRLAPLPAAAGLNFLDPKIARLAYREVVYREPGAVIEENRLWRNMLASQPVAFNLFGALKIDLAKAETWVAALLPEFTGKVTHLLFEHAPARGDEHFLGDGTAFDVFIGLKRPDGRRAFVGIEVKYAEGLTEPEPRHRPRWDDLSATSGLFVDPDDPALRANPLQQLWREHLLAHCLLENGLYDTGAFVLIAPRLNDDVQRGARLYRDHIHKGADRDPARHPAFVNITLEDAALALGSAGEHELAAALWTRYLDFSAVHELI
ncbi:PGN_0703 family putative restriction endonuclease [Caulobacter sp. KR2-114]|uniref:PGN_0703 family putative restriction endonuclease n=1 Tax=Caulobacter sp. KR2-114 TaxID=3400912 RepID=UPI003BFE0DFA